MRKNIHNPVLLVVGLFLAGFMPYTLSAQVNPNADVESKVRASFSDVPTMIDIARCESGFRQFASDGTLLRGGPTKQYIGIFQINEAHATKASSLAYDIKTVDGNIAYARHMFSVSGTNPWKGCLSTPATPAPTPVPTTTKPGVVSGSLSANLNFGMTNPQVLILQQILNKSGFVISTAGPGAPGNETTYFGGLTREALRKFQCAKGIACSGNESSTGFGRVGPLTRAALNTVQ